jgi:hypothetical protein
MISQLYSSGGTRRSEGGEGKAKKKRGRQSGTLRVPLLPSLFFFAFPSPPLLRLVPPHWNLLAVIGAGAVFAQVMFIEKMLGNLLVLRT